MNSGMIKERIASLGRARLAWTAVFAAAAVLGTGSLLPGGEKGHANVPRPESVLKAPVITVGLRSIQDTIIASGSLASKNTSVLSSKVMGRVAHVGAQEGDQVAAGKLLVRIESGEITAQVVQAQAAYNNARMNYDRIKGLYDARASTQIEMEQATLGLETAQAGLNAAKAMESYTHITAPISGQIVEKRINLGEMALPGQPIIKIEDNRHLRLEVTVKEQDILHIRPGMKVKVQIDAMPGRDLTGTVAQVVQASDVRTHSFVVKVDIPEVTGLITGMYGKALIATGSKQAIVIPKGAVVELSGIRGVYIVGDGGKAVFQMVQLGADRDGSVEVVTGLKAGDRIVADNGLGRIEGRTIEAEIQ